MKSNDEDVAILVGKLLTSAALPVAQGRIRLEAVLREFKISVDSSYLQNEHPAICAAVILSNISQWPDAMLASVYALKFDFSNVIATNIFRKANQHTISLAMDLCYSGHADVGRSIIRRMIEIESLLPDAINHPIGRQQAWLDLLDFHSSILNDHTTSINTIGRPHVISLPVWGEWFINKAAKRIIPCLLSPGNVPKLAEIGTTIICIHCHASDIRIFETLPILHKLAEHAVVKLIPFPISLKSMTSAEDNRALIAVARHASMKFAKKIGADYSPVTADMLCSENFYSESKRLIREGWGIICDGALRVVDDEMERQIIQDQLFQDDTLRLSASWLYRAGFRALHPFVRSSFMMTEPATLPISPVVFYMKSDNGFIFHGFSYAMTTMATEFIQDDLKTYLDLHTPDCRMLSDIIHGHDPNRVCFIDQTPPGDRYLVHVDTIESISQFDMRRPVTPEAAVDDALSCAVRSWDIEYFEWLIRQSIHFCLPEELGREISLPDSLSATAVVQRCLTALQERWLLKGQDIERHTQLAAKFSVLTRRRR